MSLDLTTSVEVGEVFEAKDEATAKFLCNIKKARPATPEDVAAWKKKATKGTKGPAGAGGE